MEKVICERSAVLFSALGNETRLRIIEILLERERTAGDIARELDILPSGASQHLAILTRTGILAVEAQGTSRIYRLRGPRIPRIIYLMKEFCQVHQLYGETSLPVENSPEADLAMSE